MHHGSLKQGKTKVVGQCLRGDPSPGSPWRRAEQDCGCLVPSDAGGGVTALSGGMALHPQGCWRSRATRTRGFLTHTGLPRKRYGERFSSQPSQPGGGNTRDLQVSEKMNLFPANSSSGKAAHCFLNTLVKGDTFQGIDPLVQSTCLVDK